MKTTREVNISQVWEEFYKAKSEQLKERIEENIDVFKTNDKKDKRET